jgi:hypothetical protein
VRQQDVDQVQPRPAPALDLVDEALEARRPVAGEVGVDAHIAVALALARDPLRPGDGDRGVIGGLELVAVAAGEQLVGVHACSVLPERLT